MKTLKIITNIFLFGLIFILPAQAQQADSLVEQDTKEKIELKSLSDFIAYQEAVDNGDIKPMNAEELAKQYNRLIGQMDEQFHSPQLIKGKAKTTTPVSYNTEDEPVILPANPERK